MNTKPVLFHHRFQHASDYLHIQAEQISCAIALREIDKIVSLMQLETVPKTPNYLMGVFNYHGIIVPVIDLALRLGQEHHNTVYNINSSILICETIERGELLGILVSNIHEIIMIEHNYIQLNHAFTDKPSPFNGCYHKNTEVIFLLNPNLLLEDSLSDHNTLSSPVLRELITHYLQSVK